GQLSPVVETPYGYHIIRVDRRQTGEVKAHQILIMPKLDSTDFARTQKLADSVAALWKSGVSFDSLAKKFHDYAGKEETSILTPFWRDSLPVSYQKAFIARKANDIVTFQIPGSSQRPDVPKFVVAQPGGRHAGDSAANAGRFAGRAIERAVALALEGAVDGIVTAPLDKAALLAGGYSYPGHTEMLATLTGRRVAMMLAATKPSV